MSESGRYLVDSRGQPFLIHGEAAWSLVVRLTLEQAERYVANRRERGVNAVVVNLLEHEFTDDPPRNAYHEAPFEAPGELARPNEAYFSHADDVLTRLNAAGMLVFLFPAYLGYQGGDEGWFSALGGLSVAQCREYGRFLGARYRDLPNIVWVLGGDFGPPVWSMGAVCTMAIAAGIRREQPNALMSAHWSPESSSLDLRAFAGLIQLDGVYTYDLVYPRCRVARAQQPTMPAFLFETAYENEHATTPQALRRQAYWANLTCGAGEVFGNRPIWLFDPGWEAALDSEGSRDMAYLRALFESIPWTDLEPDDGLLPGALEVFGSERWPAAARRGDGRFAIVYLPAGYGTSEDSEDAGRMIRLDLRRMAGSVQVTLFDPTAGTRQVLTQQSLSNDAPQRVEVPSLNLAGDGDWVLLLRAD